jgi:hypothetical protein
MAKKSIEVNESDAVFIIKKNLTLNLILPEMDDNAEAPYHVVYMSAIAMCAHDQDFVEYVMRRFRDKDENNN